VWDPALNEIPLCVDNECPKNFCVVIVFALPKRLTMRTGQKR
jgi:hypothetical protein